jgi:hypothetical protein
MKFPAPYYMALALSVNVAYFMSMADGGYEALAMKERMISFLPSFFFFFSFFFFYFRVAASCRS